LNTATLRSIKNATHVKHRDGAVRSEQKNLPVQGTRDMIGIDLRQLCLTFTIRN